MADIYILPTVPVVRKSAERDPLKCPGCGRDGENDHALCFYFSRPVTDNELRFLHDVMQRAAECMPEEVG